MAASSCRGKLEVRHWHASFAIFHNKSNSMDASRPTMEASLQRYMDVSFSLNNTSNSWIPQMFCQFFLDPTVTSASLFRNSRYFYFYSVAQFLTGRGHGRVTNSVDLSGLDQFLELDKLPRTTTQELPRQSFDPQELSSPSQKQILELSLRLQIEPSRVNSEEDNDSKPAWPTLYSAHEFPCARAR